MNGVKVNIFCRVYNVLMIASEKCALYSYRCCADYTGEATYFPHYIYIIVNLINIYIIVNLIKLPSEWNKKSLTDMTDDIA